MQRVKVLNVALTAIIVLSAFAATSAWALALPEFSVKTGFSGSGGSTSLEAGALSKVTCNKSTTEGTATTTNSGSFNVTDNECKDVLGTACTGLASAEGVIPLSGTWHLVPGKGTMLLLSPSAVHFSCGSAILVMVKGSLLGFISPTGTLTKEYESAFTGSSGHQELTQYRNNSGEAVSATLLASLNEGAFEEASVNTESKLTTSVEAELKGSLFRVTDSLKPGQLVKVNTEAEFKITNISQRKKIELESITLGKTKEFTFPKEAAQVKACLEKKFEPKETCIITAKYGAKEANSAADVLTEDKLKFFAFDELRGE